MRLDGPTFQRLLGSGALIAPLLAVQLTQLLADWGPALAQASETSQELIAPVINSSAEKPLTTAQQRAAAFLLAERANLAASNRELSPMYQAPQASEEPRPVPTPDLPETQDNGPKLLLTGIMAGETRQLASVNNRIVTVGDEVAPGWTITEIDVGARTVTVLGKSGRTIKLTPPSQKSR